MKMRLFCSDPELTEFQLRIAEGWFKRGEKTSDDFAKFFFFYTALNALTFLWKNADKIEGGEIPQLENLVAKLQGTVWEKLERDCPGRVSFFSLRPIERMSERQGGRSSHGNAREGGKHQRVLADAAASSEEKLKALGNILYLVRCNLAHGSKMTMGDDRPVIENAVPLLRVLSRQAILYTEAQRGQP